MEQSQDLLRIVDAKNAFDDATSPVASFAEILSVELNVKSGEYFCSAGIVLTSLVENMRRVFEESLKKIEPEVRRSEQP